MYDVIQFTACKHFKPVAVLRWPSLFITKTKTKTKLADLVILL